MKIKNIPQHVLEQLIEVIRSLVKVHSIYWIGAAKRDSFSSYIFNSKVYDHSKQEYEFTLLIISYKEICDPKTFMSEVFNKMKERVKLYSIDYSYNDIKRRLEAGDNFLSRLLLPENCLFEESPLSLTGYCYHPKKFEEIKKAWEFRLNRGSYFEDKTDTVDMVNDESARMVLVGQTILQTCAALLGVYWEWKPHYFELDLLLNLCKHFSKSPRIVLPKKSFTSKKVYSQLCHAQYNINFKTVDDVTMKDSDYASNLAERFLRKVHKEGNKKLKELELLHNRKYTNNYNEMET
ncbi:hypothetical protein APR41_06850 [Salegentibacter salinarum]|uniref:Nucleotidyltransferase n=1 Tax=Salegentibacter salinarum TaxID=447422 RepID=A0A2N0TR18_9FLAO|nr:hypothetical protein [Salegentibacter salinarum]PKD17146.1 hypothetical protein APR41_06850 [Salegentibacter salinarum]SKB55618.1 hypothetical protein SAMN05660903_01395 [Salegentibacter salinarum]